MGTKDNRQNFSKIILGKTSHQKESPCYYRETLEGLHIIAMDSHTPGSSTGSFSEEQLYWLEEKLREHRDEPSIIAFHEPVFFFGALGIFDKVDAARFRRIVSEGNILAVLNGHIHFHLTTMVDGVRYVVAGSPVFENSWYENDIISYDSSSFNLLTYHENRLFVRPVSFSEGTRLIERNR